MDLSNYRNIEALLDSDIPEPILRIDFFLHAVITGTECELEPTTHAEELLYSLATGDESRLEFIEPRTILDTYLHALQNGDTSDLPKPRTVSEMLLYQAVTGEDLGVKPVSRMDKYLSVLQKAGGLDYILSTSTDVSIIPLPNSVKGTAMIGELCGNTVKKQIEKKPIQNGLVCWIDARDGSGTQTTIKDRTGNGNNFALHNFNFDGNDGWLDNGIKLIGYGGLFDKNCIQAERNIPQAIRSYCLHFKRTKITAPAYVFDGRSDSNPENSDTYFYSGPGAEYDISKTVLNGVSSSDVYNVPLNEDTFIYLEFRRDLPNILPTIMGRYTKNETMEGCFYSFTAYDRPLTRQEIEHNRCVALGETYTFESLGESKNTIDVTVEGINLFDNSIYKFSKGAFGGAGSINPSEIDMVCEDYIPIETLKDYNDYTMYTNHKSTWIKIMFYDNNHTYCGGFSGSVAPTSTFVLSNYPSAKYFRVGFYNINGETDSKLYIVATSNFTTVNNYGDYGKTNKTITLPGELRKISGGECDKIIYIEGDGTYYYKNIEEYVITGDEGWRVRTDFPNCLVIDCDNVNGLYTSTNYNNPETHTMCDRFDVFYTTDAVEHLLTRAGGRGLIIGISKNKVTNLSEAIEYIKGTKVVYETTKPTRVKISDLTFRCLKSSIANLDCGDIPPTKVVVRYPYEQPTARFRMK